MTRIANHQTVEFRVRITKSQRARLQHHALRLGHEMSSIMRESLCDRLDLLDEKEAISMERERARARGGAHVPTVVQHPWGKPRGLNRTSRSTAATAPRMKVPEKLTKSLPRWANDIERANGSEAAVDEVLANMREKSSSETEVSACYELLKDLLRERAEGRMQKAVPVGENTEVIEDNE